MISTRISKRLSRTSAVLAGTVIAVVGLSPTLASATGGEPCCHGRLIVEKTVEGDSSGPFGFNLKCEGDDIDRNFTLDANTSKDFAAIKTGAICLITETDSGGADSTKVTPSDGTVVIGDDDPVTVSFVNVFAPTPPATIVPLAAVVAPTTTTTTIVPTVLGVTLTAPAPIVPPAELPRTGSSTTSTFLTAGLVLTALGIALRRQATRSAASLR